MKFAAILLQAAICTQALALPVDPAARGLELHTGGPQNLATRALDGLEEREPKKECPHRSTTIISIPGNVQRDLEERE